MIKAKSIQKTVVALLIAVALFGCAKSGNNLPTTEKNSVTQSAYADKNTTVSGSTKAEAAADNGKTTASTSDAKSSDKSTTDTTVGSTIKGNNKATEKRGGSVSGTVTVTTKHKVEKKQHTKSNKPTARTTAATTKSKSYAYLTVECKVLLNAKSKKHLAPGHSRFVPSDGYIIKDYACKPNGDSVYDVLSKACKSKSIHLTAKNSPYEIYVSGINNLDEKDCGSYSGWKYKVNGKYPPYTCERYKVSAGDEIVWEYVTEA